ncbi:hypothetical protein GC170_11685 [bacterium]|nr:hypothetical protein [bacterium]
MVRRSVQALALMVAATTEHAAQADFPVVVQSYSIVPESVVILPGTVLMPTGLSVVAPRTVVRYESFPGPIVPTVTWLPGVTYLQTTEWLPLEMPCGSTVIETPLTGSTVVESPVLSSPQTRTVEELPIESKAQETAPEPAKEGADQEEPDLKHNVQTPPGLPEPPKANDLKPAAEAPKAEAPKDDDIPPNETNPGASLPPAKETPRNAAPAEPPPAAKPSPTSDKETVPPAGKPTDPVPSIPLPEAASETKVPPAKTNAPVEPPPAAPADEAKPGALVEPGSPSIPLPEASVPELAPVKPDAAKSPVTPTSATGKSAEEKPAKTTEPAKNAEATKPLIELPEIPPPVDELPPAKEKETVRPVTPLPDLPLPEDLPPAQDTSAKPLDPQAVKAAETTMKRREAQRPVIESKPGGAAEPAIAELEILVRSSRSGSPEDGVTVRFLENTSGERFEAVTDRSGFARVMVPKGAWEVEVESLGGRRYVLGDVVSQNGRVTTSSGRDLPRLEIQR